MKPEKHNFYPGVLAIAILFWSWTLNILLLGIGIAAFLEAARWIPWRFQLQEQQLIRIIKLLLFVLVIFFVILVITELNNGLNIFIQWLPLLLAPILFTQLYHTSESFPFRSFIESFTGRPNYSGSVYPATIDLRLPYTLLTLVASSLSAPTNVWTFSLFFTLIIVTLLPVRPKSFRLTKWFLLCCLVFVLGFVIKESLNDLRSYLRNMTTEWLTKDWSQSDTFKTHTAIGKIGELKLSNQIVMRIKSNEHGPLLLRQAIYNHFVSNNWHMQQTAFNPVPHSEDDSHWLLSSEKPLDSSQLNIASSLQKGEGVLALPYGSTEIINQRPAKLSMNSNGSVRISESPSALDYTVSYSSTIDNNSVPDHVDLLIPGAYQELVKRTVEDVGLKSLSASEAAKKLKQYFEKDFKYSLWQDNRKLLQNPLEHFLANSKKGHCEYFATAGALILRELGIATRYATGFAMSEFDNSTQTYVIRQRHAHAWVEAYINGGWTTLDYTPSTWAALEAEQSPWWQGIQDAFDYQRDKLVRLWQDNNDAILMTIQIVIVIILFFYMTKRLKFVPSNFSWQRRRRYKRVQSDKTNESSFIQIIEYLEHNIEQRKPGETILRWLQRIDKQLPNDLQSLSPLLKQHYALVYGRQQMSSEKLQQYKADVEQWLKF